MSDTQNRSAAWSDLPTPDQARAALAEATSAHVVSRRDITALTVFVGGVGVIVAAILFLSWATLSVGNVAGFAASMGGYAVALGLLLLVKARAASVPRGFRRIYNIGFATTMTLYVASIGWIFAHQSPWPTASLVLALCIVTALPCLVAAFVVQAKHRVARR